MHFHILAKNKIQIFLQLSEYQLELFSLPPHDSLFLWYNLLLSIQNQIFLFLHSHLLLLCSVQVFRDLSSPSLLRILIFGFQLFSACFHYRVLKIRLENVLKYVRKKGMNKTHQNHMKVPLCSLTKRQHYFQVRQNKRNGWQWNLQRFVYFVQTYLPLYNIQ